MKNRITRRLLVLSLAIVCLLALSGSAVAAELPVKYEAPVVVVAASGTSTVAPIRPGYHWVWLPPTRIWPGRRVKTIRIPKRLSMPLFRWVLTKTSFRPAITASTRNTITLPDQPAF